VVIREIERIDGLVGRLRGLAAPSREGLLPVDIREPILETLSLLRAQFEQSGTTVYRYLPEVPPFVSVASDQLKQLFLNLFLNAIEAMGHGGDLTVRVRMVDRTSDALITVEISDTGPGVQDAIKSKIFDPFFTTKSRGSGLGLAICHSIADAHRGSIRAENNAKGPGTTIVVEFPVAVGSLELVQSKSPGN
jgi:signal transduction histidine kinase